jgi:hypothetical protein
MLSNKVNQTFAKRILECTFCTDIGLYVNNDWLVCCEVCNIKYYKIYPSVIDNIIIARRSILHMNPKSIFYLKKKLLIKYYLVKKFKGHRRVIRYINNYLFYN